MDKRYLLFPGYVQSVTNGDVYRVSARQLMDIHHLNPAECVIFRAKRPIPECAHDLIHITPKSRIDRWTNDANKPERSSRKSRLMSGMGDLSPEEQHVLYAQWQGKSHTKTTGSAQAKKRSKKKPLNISGNRFAGRGKGARKNRLQGIKEACASYLEGYSPREISERLDVTLPTIYGWLRRSGIILRPKQRLEDIKRLAQDGKDSAEISTELGVTQKWIQAVCSRHEIRLKRKPRFDMNRALTIGELYLSGHTMAAIGREYGLSRERIRQILKRVGICTLKQGKLYSDEAIKNS